MKAALSGFWQHAMEPRLPADVEPAWFQSVDEAAEAMKGARVAQLDLLCDQDDFIRVLDNSDEIEWVACCFAGVDRFPLEYMAERGIKFTNGVGLNAVPVGEWAVMGCYTIAKGFADIVRMHDRKDWSMTPYGTVQVSQSNVLVIGYGHIGKEIARQLRGIGAEVTVVRSKADPVNGVLGPDDWRERLNEFDFVILAAPGTPETHHMIGADELKAMKGSAGLINIARGALVDQAALKEAMEAGEIAGALLDPADPEPLPKDDPLWDAKNTLVTAHLSGRSQTIMPRAVTDLFLDNLKRLKAGEELINLVNTSRGY